MADFYERLAARLKRRPEETQAMPVSNKLKIAPITDSDVYNTIGGFRLDPKANKRSDESIPAFMGRRIREAATDTYAPMNNAVISTASAAAPIAKEFVGGLTNTTPVASPASPVRTVPRMTDNAFTPSPAEEAARRSRMPVNTIARPEGVANIQRGTGVVEAPIANIKGRISPENPYGADVVYGNMRTGQVRGISTQEEADRNLQSRLEQDAAAQQMAASYNRSTEALRDLRAERRGISRNALDIAEGRVEGPAAMQQSGQSGGQFGDEILDRDRFLRQFAAPPGASNRIKNQAQQNMAAAQQVWNQNQQAMQKPVTQAPGINPLDAQRFLLDQQKFGWQQGVDKGRLTLDQAKIQNEAATTSLAQKKQDLEAKSAFTENFSIGKDGAPDKTLAAGAWEISKATGVPPEIVQGYIQNADFDWENGPPANMTEFFKSITAQITRDYRGQ